MKRLFLNICLAPLFAAETGGGGGGNTEKPESSAEAIKRLTAENEQLRGKIADAEKDAAKKSEHEKAIGEKTSKGLTREQAVMVLRRQEAHDKMLEAQWAGRRADIVAILKTVSNPREQRKQINELYPGVVTVEEINAAKESIKVK